MVTNNLSIRNFKSIKQLDLKTKRVNIFIGEPNSGKSNILEALSFFSVNALNNNDFKERFRFQKASDLFYDLQINSPVEIKTDPLSLKIDFAKTSQGALLNFFALTFSENPPNKKGGLKTGKIAQGTDHTKVVYDLKHGGEIDYSGQKFSFPTMYRKYDYKPIQKFYAGHTPYLSSPYGENLPSLLLSNSKLRDTAKMFFKDKGYKLLIDSENDDLKVVKEDDDTLIMYPYTSISETLKRIVFLMIAIESNTNAAIILDEPEANTFPFYTKYIAERIALDKSNQYFITTHNPYLLSNLIQRTNANDINLCVVKMVDYQTKVFPLSNADIIKAVGMGDDVFFNLDKFSKQ